MWKKQLTSLLAFAFFFANLLGGTDGSDASGDTLSRVVSRVHAASLPNRDVTYPEALEKIVSASDPSCSLSSQATNALSKPKWDEEEGYDYFDVVLDVPKGKSLGISFMQRGKYLYISDMKRGSVAEKSNSVKLQDEIVAVNFQSLVALGLRDTVAGITGASNPRTFRLRRKQKSSSKGTRASAREAAAERARNEKKRMEEELKREMEKFDFDVTFRSKGPLGISLRDNMEVSAVVSGGAASKSKKIAVGDILLSVNGKGARSKSMDAAKAAQMISSATYPMVLRFRPASGANEDEIRMRLKAIVAEEVHEDHYEKDEQPSEAFIKVLEPGIMAGKSWSGIPALFGSTFGSSGSSCESASLVAADDEKACKTFKKPKSFYEGKVVVVKRGRCTFVTKALAVQKLGAAGMIVISDAKPVVEMPSGAGEKADDVKIPCAMIDESAGLEILGMASSGLVKIQYSGGSNGKSLCKATATQSSESIDRTQWEYEMGTRGRKEKRRLVQNAARLLIWSPELPSPSTVDYFALAARFGKTLTGAVEASAGRIELLPLPGTGCKPLKPPPGSAGYTGAIVLVNRGECTFNTKASNVQNAGGIGMIVVNNIDGYGKLIPMPGDPGQEKGTKIPVAMMTKGDGDRVRSFILRENNEGILKKPLGRFAEVDKPSEKPPKTLAKLTVDTRYWCNSGKFFFYYPSRLARA